VLRATVFAVQPGSAVVSAWATVAAPWQAEAYRQEVACCGANAFRADAFFDGLGEVAVVRAEVVSSSAASPPPRAVLVSELGDAKSSLGDAKSSLGDAKSSLGDAKSSLGDAKSSLGDAESSLGDAKSSLGDTESSLGDAKSSLGALFLTLTLPFCLTGTHVIESGAGGLTPEVDTPFPSNRPRMRPADSITAEYHTTRTTCLYISLTMRGEVGAGAERFGGGWWWWRRRQ
jgi:hypothetical protein